MNYFQYQDQLDYGFTDSTGKTYTLRLTDITERAKIAERLNQFTSVMYDYMIKEEQRPDLVAQIVYGDVRYTWLVLLINNIMTLYDWPLTNEEFVSYIISKYGSLNAAHTGTKTYYTAAGDRVDKLTYDSLPPAQQGESLTPYEQELQDNEAKRRIKVIPTRFLSSIEQSLKSLYR